MVLGSAFQPHIFSVEFFLKVEAHRGAGAQACDSNRDRLWVRLPFEEIKYLLFSFLRSGNEANRDYSTCNASRISGGK